MTFAYPWVLLFLWVIPLLIFIWVICEKLRKKALERFASPGLHCRLTGQPEKGRKFIKYVMLLNAIGLMIIALSGPRWGFYYQDKKGVDIMILADVSASMLANDVPPTRLERSRREISDFLNIIHEDRAGLIAFAGAAFVQCPLTQDYGAITMFLDLLDPELVPVPGTDLGAAIEVGVSSFDFKSETDKVIFLITDGEDHEGGGLAAAQSASEKGVKIFVLGVGEATGAPVPDAKQAGSFKKDHLGETIISKPDIEGLKKIAIATGGTYVQSIEGDSDLEALYVNGIKARTKEVALKNDQLKVHKERFALFLVPAILLLLAEAVIFERRWVPFSPICYTALFYFIFVSYGYCAEDPDALYRKGRYLDAERIYRLLDMDRSEDIRYRYNGGCALYRIEAYQGAAIVFSSVLKKAQNNDERFRAAYNLGNLLYMSQKFKAAAKFFKMAVGYDPDNEDARYNLELALRRINPRESEKPPQKNDLQDKRSSQQSQSNPNMQSQSGANVQSRAEHTQNRPEQTDSNDLSGELKAMDAMPELQDDNPFERPDKPSMDEKKAAAFLDNVKEDRTQFQKSRIPKEERDGAWSRKDW